MAQVDTVATREMYFDRILHRTNNLLGVIQNLGKLAHTANKKLLPPHEYPIDSPDKQLDEEPNDFVSIMELRLNSLEEAAFYVQRYLSSLNNEIGDRK